MTAPPIVRAMAGWGPPPSLQGWFLSFYLALAPVYLIPGIELRELWWVKAGLLMAAFALVFIPALLRRELRLPGGILGVWGFGALAAVSIPGMAQAADLRDALFYLIDIGLGALFLWCFCHLARRGDDLATVFLRALGVMGLLAGMAIVRTWVNAPDWGSPFYRLWNTEINAGFGHSQVDVVDLIGVVSAGGGAGGGSFPALAGGVAAVGGVRRAARAGGDDLRGAVVRRGAQRDIDVGGSGGAAAGGAGA